MSNRYDALKQYSFKSTQRLKSKDDFKRLFEGKRSFATPYFVFYYQKAESPRLGIIVSRKCSKQAVIRNRIKRVTREAFRLNQAKISSADWLVLARGAAATASPQELRPWLEKAFFHAL